MAINRACSIAAKYKISNLASICKPSIVEELVNGKKTLWLCLEQTLES